MKKIIDGVLYDTTAMTKVSCDDYGAEVHTIYTTSDGKYIVHTQEYGSDGKLEREDLVDKTDKYLEDGKWIDFILNGE